MVLSRGEVRLCVSHDVYVCVCDDDGNDVDGDGCTWFCHVER